MAEKPAPTADDSYSEEETDRRMDATVRAMLAMPPKPRASPARKSKRRVTSKGVAAGVINRNGKWSDSAGATPTLATGC